MYVDQLSSVQCGAGDDLDCVLILVMHGHETKDFV